MLRCRSKMATIVAKSLLTSQTPPFNPKFVSQFPTFTRFTSNFARFHKKSALNRGLGGFGCENNRLLSRFGVKSFNLGTTRALCGVSGGSKKLYFLSWYMAALDKHPVKTKAVTSALLTLLGDLICQVLIDQVSTIDWSRTFVFTSLGLVLVGPSLHYWYLFLSRLIKSPGASGAFLRLMLDQLVFAPAFIGIVLSSVIALEGRPSQITQKLKQEWFSAVLANWQLWVPFQFLNFRFVPQKFQVLAANIVSLAWNAILSYKAHKAIEAK